MLNKTKTELELSKEANDRKAQQVDKVQKAQTKRWLKNEYKVALRAGVGSLVALRNVLIGSWLSGFGALIIIIEARRHPQDQHPRRQNHRLDHQPRPHAGVGLPNLVAARVLP